MANERCGLTVALRQAEEDLRYPLGSRQPLSNLIEEFKYSQNHARKIGELQQRGYTHFRRVRGDGNCFYRAVGLGWLEGLATRPMSEKDAPGGSFSSFSWPPTASFGQLAGEYEDLRKNVDFLMRRPDKRQAFGVGANLLKRLLTDVRFDLCVVVFIRLLAATFLERTDKEMDDATDVLVSTVVADHGSVQQFVNKEVLPLGKEAEGASIVVVAQQLSALLRIVQLDGSSFQGSDAVFPREDYVSPLGIRMCLLYRPGHYEILYHRDASQLEDPTDLWARCSSCREPASLPSNGLLVCFHRVCARCSRSLVQENRDEIRCPVCNQVPSLHWGAAAAPQPDSYSLQHRGMQEAFRENGQSYAAGPPKTSHLSAGMTLPDYSSHSRAGPPKTSKLSADMTPPYYSNDPRAGMPTPSHSSRAGTSPNLSEWAAAQSAYGERHQYASSAPWDMSNASAAGMREGAVQPPYAGGGRPATLPQTSRALTSDMLHGGVGNARPLQSQHDGTFSPHPPNGRDQRDARASQMERVDEATARSQAEASRAGCQNCSARKDLNKVRCCGSHYCKRCLTTMITACDRPGARLNCSRCRMDWDPQKLARACNLEVPSAACATNGTSGYPHHRPLGSNGGNAGMTMPMTGPRVPVTTGNLAVAPLPGSQYSFGR